MRGVDLKNPRPWLVSGLASLAAGGIMYAVAMDQKGKFLDTSERDEPGDEQELYGYRDRANAFGTASIVTGSVGLALSATGVGLQIRFGSKRAPKLEPVAAHQEDTR